ncbi:MAG: endonuclease/exonuclease/phosphatase (EEP) superfamily protein YafD [Psychromonas sp.]|jgi:endonuclease/exonuclease/phosphatase (EEP) superfamily protein YafD|uniref:endonuclease/exonuclease/phosphatase family protein n=1 Tax=Psychromonas sp. TaxID=1884585 RepID=UPI0039E530E4
MKRNLTLLSTTMIMTVYLPVIIILIAVLTIFPKSAQHLTLLDNKERLYLQSCPELATVKAAFGSAKKLALPFTLLNWNIYKQQHTNWQKALQKWTQKSDLLTLQEIKYSPAFINFSQINSLFYFQNNAFQYQDVVYGVNTLSKVAPSYVCGTRYSEPWISIPKTGIATIYPLENLPDSLLLINIHGVNFTFTAAPLMEQIQPYLALIKSHRGPVIFSGDFNTWSAQRLEQVAQTLLQADFQDALFANDQRITIFGQPLDHIYYRGLQVVKSESWATKTSDHNPQLVTFKLR